MIYVAAIFIILAALAMGYVGLWVLRGAALARAIHEFRIWWR